MSEKKPRVFIGQLNEREGPYGKFLSGRFGVSNMVISPSKEPGKHNVYLEEAPKQTDRREAPRQAPFEDRMADDGIPF